MGTRSRCFLIIRLCMNCLQSTESKSPKPPTTAPNETRLCDCNRSQPNRFNLFIFLFLMWTLNASVANAFTVQCKEDFECSGEHIQCLDQEDCIVYCDGDMACLHAMINCTSISHPCYVECNGYDSCSHARIISGRSDLFVSCRGWYSCNSVHIDAFEAQSFVAVNTTFEDLAHATIQCPRHGADNDCVIDIWDTWWLPGGWWLSIYAVNAFRDIELYIDDMDCYLGGECDQYPTVFCTENFNESCTMQFVNGIWKCNDTNSVCNQFLDFTSAPTLPTSSPTNAPSISPIYAIPYSSDDTLYVRQSGCDHGDCSSDLAQFEVYCNNHDFYYGSFSPCCSQYASPPPINETLVPTDCQGSYVSINETAIYNHTAIGNVYHGGNEGWLPLCFYVQPSFICRSPKVDVRFEVINYNDVEGRYLNIGYQNKSNLLNTEECRQPLYGLWDYRNCGTFLDCQLDAFSYLGDPGDGPWLNGFKVFYAINGMHVGEMDNLRCRNITLNVRMSVECSSSQSTKQFACKTMNYTLRCLTAEGFEGCFGYDGNGMIDIGEGTFSLNQSIIAKHKQIMFKGVSSTSTVLQHTLESEPGLLLIHCEYQCYLMLQTLQYSAPNNHSKIEIINNGHMTFDGVLFINYDASFIIDGLGTNVTFVNCEFRDNHMHQNGFTISDGAHVLFKSCKFKNNSFFADVFVVNNAILVFEDTSFNLNTASLSEDLIVVNGGSLHLKHCVFYQNEAFNTLFQINHLYDLSLHGSLFIANTNMNRLVYASNVTDISISDTTIDRDNLCHDDQYVSIVNSNLSIDQYSVSVQVPQNTWLPTVSPTVQTSNPTTHPTMPTPRPTREPTLGTIATNTTECDDGRYCYDVAIYPKINQQTHFMTHPNFC
eukprot:121400_1